jgi:AraC-like DNA-binding protein
MANAMKRIHYVLHKAREKVEFDGEPSRGSGTILVIDPGETSYLSDLSEGLSECNLIHQKEHHAAWKLFLSNPVDLVLLDHSRETPCFRLLSQLKTAKPSTSVVIMTDQGSEAVAVKAFRHGARDYFKKPLPLDELELTLRCILGLRNTSEVPPAAIPLKGLELAFQHIHSRFKSPLTLGQIAEKAGMSVSSFVRSFKKKTGLTFVDYVNSLRLSHAGLLLKEGRLSLLEIALSCGFNSQSHFNRVFKKIYGVTPGEYRRDLTRRSAL